MVHLKTPRHIDRAGPALSKSDEFSGGPSIVHELDSQIVLETVKNMLQLLGPGVPSGFGSAKEVCRGTTGLCITEFDYHHTGPYVKETLQL